MNIAGTIPELNIFLHASGFKIIDQILKNLPILKEWLDSEILKKLDNESWNDSIKKLHDPIIIPKFII